MKTFKIDGKFEITCKSENTRYGFRHLAELFRTGLSGTTVLIGKAKVCYYNRTWESFEFETVLRSLLNKTNVIPEDQRSEFLNKCRKNESDEFNGFLGLVSGIAKLGNIFCDNQKDSNDWKTRMLKAGLPDLDIPEDWNNLSEDEKEKRLDNVIKLSNLTSQEAV
jgi:hypothetical protein